MALEKYCEKRNFEITSEPDGASIHANDDPIFVVQKHAARRLHYDFRLAHNGVLLSWAIPKGPSMNPAHKRLAIRTEDHPLDYADFEGVIPEGQYGAGEVILWDRGEFQSDENIENSLQKGRLTFELEGEKLRGAFQLIRMEDEDDSEEWLLIKSKDANAQTDREKKNITETHPESIKSGKTIEEIEFSDVTSIIEDLEGAKESMLPSKMVPMLPTLLKEVPQGEEWLHEIKWDGYRLLGEKKDGRVRLFTRNLQDWTDRFRPIADALDKLCEHNFLIDGEAVVIDAEGRSQFQSLQGWMKTGRGDLCFYAFDVLYLCDHDLQGVKLINRKSLLQHWLHEKKTLAHTIRYSEHVQGNGQEFFQAAREKELEGVVSKLGSSFYRAGRSRSWMKTKCSRTEEFVVVGYTEPTGSRSHFGALLLAAKDKQEKLSYAGKVGSGFDNRQLEKIYDQLKKIERKTSPLQANQKLAPSDTHWVRPKLVCIVDYAEKTQDGLLRQPVYIGLREDKPAEEIQLDKAEALPNQKAMKEPNKSNKPVVAGIAITHADRVIDEASGVTKLDLAAYYAEAAEWMAPYLKNRPLSLVRCPKGLDETCFYQKHFSDGAPGEIKIVQLQEKSGKQPYAYVNDRAGLVALAQYGVIELHGWGARKDKPDKPDVLVFDLDPADDVRWAETLGAAFLVRDMLQDIGLTSFPKLTGGKGIHVCAPINRSANWDEAKPFCKRFAEALTKQNRERFIAKASKAARKGKIYIDYLRNGYGATAILPYSTRARFGFPVAALVDWEELDIDQAANHWTISNIRQRMKNKKERPWRAYASTRQSLTAKRMSAF